MLDDILDASTVSYQITLQHMELCNNVTDLDKWL